MNLEEKIGQLLIIGFKGAAVSPDSPIIRDIRERNLGGVILFDRFLAEKLPENNIISEEQTKKLIADLQQAAATPLLVAVDQEGGRVNRFKAERGFLETPAAAFLGGQPDTAATIAAAEQTATLLVGLGFNLNLAPVVDLDTFPDNPIIGRYQRSFSCDAGSVAEHAAVWVEAHRRHGVKTCLKHFPGHGSARADSHLGFVDVSGSWHEEELAPYRSLIGRGLADTVMSGHLFNRALDSTYPATLSKATITGLLRNNLGFTGPVLSDDLQMRAITATYGLEEAVCRAVTAGVDLLVFGNNLDYDPDIAKKVIGALTDAVYQGALPEKTIDTAWQRVQMFKRAFSQ